MFVKQEIIDKKREILLKQLKEEINMNGDYRQWYSDLESFRKSIRKYYSYRFGKEKFRVKMTVLDSGDIIDHHIISYFAPLDYSRIGWDRKLRTASEQVIMLAQYFKRHGVRFIYVPLPNKGVVYPDMISDEEILHQKTYNSPQYRKLIGEIASDGVEVIDMFQVFCTSKTSNLFSKRHNISAQGAKVVADEIASYLTETTDELPHDTDLILKRERQYVFEPESSHQLGGIGHMVFCEKEGVKVPYWNQKSCENKIVIFGDCNMQAYRNWGGGVAANLAYNLQYAVYDAGRFLPFDFVDSITEQFLQNMLKKEIVIYVAFASAGFVRTSQISYRNFGKYQNWSTISLE